MEYRTVSTRLSVDEFTLIMDYCRRKNITPSALIKDLLSSEVTPPIGVHVSSGKNTFEYDKKNDLFTWNIELDDGNQITVLKSLNYDYLAELNSSISQVLTLRNELQGKKKKGSVLVPGKLIGRNK